MNIKSHAQFQPSKTPAHASGVGEVPGVTCCCVNLEHPDFLQKVPDYRHGQFGIAASRGTFCFSHRYLQYSTTDTDAPERRYLVAATTTLERRAIRTIPI